MFKKLIQNMCPFSKKIIKIAAIFPFILIPLMIFLLIFTDSIYIRENFLDLLTLSVALPVSAVIVSLLGDLVWRDKTKN